MMYFSKNGRFRKFEFYVHFEHEIALIGHCVAVVYNPVCNRTKTQFHFADHHAEPIFNESVTFHSVVKKV